MPREVAVLKKRADLAVDKSRGVTHMHKKQAPPSVFERLAGRDHLTGDSFFSAEEREAMAIARMRRPSLEHSASPDGERYRAAYREEFMREVRAHEEHRSPFDSRNHAGDDAVATRIRLVQEFAGARLPHGHGVDLRVLPGSVFGATQSPHRQTRTAASPDAHPTAAATPAKQQPAAGSTSPGS